MDALLIQNKIDLLASGVDNNFSYTDLINNNKNQILWAVQIALAQCYKYEFRFGLNHDAKLFGNAEFYQFRSQLEKHFQTFIEEQLLINIKKWDTTQPADNYIHFLKQLISNHPICEHQFFTEFLPKKATKEDLRFYLAQESVPRFDDLLSLIQIGNPETMKMELAKNYWDEMGGGNFEKVHATMFSKVIKYFNITAEYVQNNVLASSLISDNLSTMLAIYRENYAHAIGFQAVTEYCVPARFQSFIEGCRRLSIEEDILSYHILHTDIDAEHAEGWFQKIVKPMIEANPNIADKITEGAFLKLNSSQLFFDGILGKLLAVETIN